MNVLSGLSEISSEYDLIFCDVWGVVHNGRESFKPACEALAAFRDAGGVVIMVTNAPVPKDRVVGVMGRVGVPNSCYDDVATSGMATQRELVKFGAGPLYSIGPIEGLGLYDGLGVTFTEDPKMARAISCTSLRNPETEEPELYRVELERLAALELPMVCANPDVQFRYGDSLIWAAGALANLYEEVGGRVVRPGKPAGPIYELARELAVSVSGSEVAKDRVLAIGDGPDTDIKGAVNEGVASMFIGGGLYGDALDGQEGFADLALSILRKSGVDAAYAMPELAW